MNGMRMAWRVGALRWVWVVSAVLMWGESPKVAVAQDVIGLGDRHSCAVIDDALKCWGKNDDGQLGIAENDLTSRSKPTDVLIIGAIRAADGGRNSTCAIVDDGVRCWGQGQLGSDSSSSEIPIPVSGLDTNANEISVSDTHACAVVASGLFCWGLNTYGQLGSGDTQASQLPFATLPADAGVTSVSSGGYHTCAIILDRVYCWGDNSNKQLGVDNPADPTRPGLVPGLASATRVAAGEQHTCAIDNGGTVYCWGDNVSHQLDQPTSAGTQSAVPIEIQGISNAVAIAAGARHTCALTQNGSVSCWGANLHGQLGDYRTLSRGNDVLNGLPASAIAAGGDHTCAATAIGVYCWGSDEFAELGDGGPLQAFVTVPTMVLASDTYGVFAGGTSACALISTPGTLACWGNNIYGVAGFIGLYQDQASPYMLNAPATASSANIGTTHACAIFGTTVRCWGANGYGQLGDGSTTLHTDPTSVIGLGGSSDDVAAGANHSCARLTNGHVQCWGNNAAGQLGNGHTTNESSPVDVMVSVLPIPLPLSVATSVAAGTNHSCAVVTSGVVCWGANANGQLGNGTNDPASTAKWVSGLGAGVSQIAAGSGFTCAIQSSAIQCWGAGTQGQLGNGSSINSNVPVAVTGIAAGATSVSTGTDHACAVVNSGVKCWGGNGHGQLGNGTSGSGMNVPVDAIPAGSNIVSVAAGDQFTCATDSDGAMYCWGFGMYGRLADGHLYYSPHPVHVFERLFLGDFERPENSDP